MPGFLINTLLLTVITSPASATATSPGFVGDKFIFREEMSAVTPRHRRKHYRNAAIQHSWGIWLCQGCSSQADYSPHAGLFADCLGLGANGNPAPSTIFFFVLFFWQESINLIKN